MYFSGMGGEVTSTSEKGNGEDYDTMGTEGIHDRVTYVCHPVSHFFYVLILDPYSPLLEVLLSAKSLNKHS